MEKICPLREYQFRLKSVCTILAENLNLDLRSIAWYTLYFPQTLPISFFQICVYYLAAMSIFPKLYSIWIFQVSLHLNGLSSTITLVLKTKSYCRCQGLLHQGFVLILQEIRYILLQLKPSAAPEYLLSHYCLRLVWEKFFSILNGYVNRYYIFSPLNSSIAEAP